MIPKFNKFFEYFLGDRPIQNYDFTRYFSRLSSTAIFEVIFADISGVNPTFLLNCIQMNLESKN